MLILLLGDYELVHKFVELGLRVQPQLKKADDPLQHFYTSSIIVSVISAV